MAAISTRSADEQDRMHDLYRRGGQARPGAPTVVYPEADCPHIGCGRPMHAIDFRLEDHGRTVPDPLVRAWWNDTGFAGRCPHCGGWVHFTIRGKRAITADEATGLPHFPDNWSDVATIL